MHFNTSPISQILLLGYPPSWHQLPSPSSCRHCEQSSHRDLASHGRSKLVSGGGSKIKAEKLYHHRASNSKSEQKSSTNTTPLLQTQLMPQHNPAPRRLRVLLHVLHHTRRLVLPPIPLLLHHLVCEELHCHDPSHLPPVLTIHNKHRAKEVVTSLVVVGREGWLLWLAVIERR